MAEEPEEVLPEHGDATALDLEDMGAEVAVAPEQHEGAREHREGDQDQDAGHEHVPGEDRHPEHGHPGARR